jgi:hypothetical protein
VTAELPLPVFLDTSIHIARLVHSPATKKRIAERLHLHGQTLTSLVARQEFKRRLLAEADYLLRLVDRYKSFIEVYHHVIRLPNVHQRKKNICFQIMGEMMFGSEEERTERFRCFLKSLLLVGLKRFDQSVDVVRKESGCGCGIRDITTRPRSNKFDLGPNKCNDLPAGACKIKAFLTQRDPEWRQVLAYLQGLPEPDLTSELQTAKRVLEDLQIGKFPENPCTVAGDLLIALESAGIPVFYTLNSQESQYLCRPMQQTLIVLRPDPTKPEVVCESSEATWPKFQKPVIKKKPREGDA